MMRMRVSALGFKKETRSVLSLRKPTGIKKSRYYSCLVGMACGGMGPVIYSGEE
jgi:hypothetical protein